MIPKHRFNFNSFVISVRIVDVGHVQWQNLHIKKSRCAQGTSWHLNIEAYANCGVIKRFCGSRVIENETGGAT